MGVLCSHITSGAQDGMAALQMLQTHILEAGGSIDCVEPAIFEGMRGMRASCDVEKGRVFMFTPAKMMISTSTTDQQLLDLITPSDETMFLVKRGKDSPSAVVMLAMVVLRELALGSQSPFAAYIATWPADPPSILALADELQIKALSSVLSDALPYQEQMLKGVADHVLKSPDTFGNPSEIQQRRAIAYVLSRSRAYE